MQRRFGKAEIAEVLQSNGKYILHSPPKVIPTSERTIHEKKEKIFDPRPIEKSPAKIKGKGEVSAKKV